MIPAFVLLAVWFLAWLVRRLRDRPGVSGRTRPAAVALGAALLLVPTAATAAGIMGYRMDVGSIAATRQTCAQIPDQASVVIVDPNTASKFMQLIRGMCAVPTAHLPAPDDTSVARIVAEIHARDRDAVLVADRAERLHSHLPPGAGVSHPFDVHTDQDPSTLMRPPSGAWRFNGELWLAVIPRP